MDIHQLRYFVAVAEELHFGRAAERLMVTPSPLSKQIRRLERELGGDLLIREHHSVHLTTLGQQVLEPIRDILARIDDLKTIRSNRATQLNVGATPLAPADVIDYTVERLHTILGDHPIELTLNTTSNLLPLLETRKIDLALVYLPVPSPRFAAVEVAEHGTLVVMGKDDPLATRSELRLTDLADAPLVVSVHDFNPDHMRDYREKLRTAGLTNLIDVSHGHPSVMAANVRLSRARALITDVPNNPAHAAFPSDTFAAVPLAAGELSHTVAFVALQARLDERTLISMIYREFSELIASGNDQTGAGAAGEAGDESETESSK